MSWIVETLNEVVDREVEALPEDMRARLVRIASGMRVVVVRAFVKKIQATPIAEIDLALRRAQEIEK
jgi:phage-related protein